MSDNLERTATVIPFSPTTGGEREFSFGAWVAFAHAPTFYSRVMVKITRDYFGRVNIKVAPYPEDPSKMRARTKELLDGTSIRFFPVLPEKPSDIVMASKHAEIIAKWYYSFQGVDKTALEFLMLDIVDILVRGW